MTVHRPLLAALSAAALLAVPASAEAVTIGGLPNQTPGGSDTATVIQVSADTGPAYTVPPGSWAVTSISTRYRTDQNGKELSVSFYRPFPDAPAKYTVVRKTAMPIQPSTPETVLTQPTGFNVQGGDVLGYGKGLGVSVYFVNNLSLWRYSDGGTAPETGQTYEPTDISSSGQWAISAELEPDADADGVPDASDNCPGTAACRTDVEGLVQVNPTSLLRGRTAQIAVSVSNRGTDPASNVNAVVALPKGVTVLASGNPALCPLRQTALTCRFGTLDRGAQRTVYLRVKATTEGTKSISLTAAHSGVDPVGGNNRSFIALSVRKTCVVPSKGLKGQTLRTAKRRLKAAGCAKTKTVKPKRVPRGSVLRVSDVSPKATQEANKRITITLKARKRKR